MRDSDDKRFKALLSGLAEFYRRDLTEAMLEGYWLALKPYPIDEIEAAVTRCLGECKFMPMPTDIVEHASGFVPVGVRAERAWVCLQDAIRAHGGWASIEFEDRAIADIVRRMGGWERVSGMTYDEVDWRRKEFAQLYTVYVKHENHDGEPRLVLKGLHGHEEGVYVPAPYLRDLVRVGGGFGRVEAGA